VWGGPEYLKEGLPSFKYLNIAICSITDIEIPVPACTFVRQRLRRCVMRGVLALLRQPIVAALCHTRGPCVAVGSLVNPHATAQAHVDEERRRRRR
jgi:hypothetical protein